MWMGEEERGLGWVAIRENEVATGGVSCVRGVGGGGVQCRVKEMDRWCRGG